MPRRSTTNSPEEAAALQAAGARLERHAHDMVLDLPADCPAEPSLPEGLSLRPGREASPGLTDALLAAYPPGHPDVCPSGRTRRQADQEIADLLAGTAGGPVVHDASAVVTDAVGAVSAAVVVTRIGPEPWGWPGGPWVATVLVVPRWQEHGVGRAVMCWAIARCTAAGEARIGLTVTDGNPAERLYRGLGFQRRRTLYVLDA